jgi:hypothetical protein
VYLLVFHRRTPRGKSLDPADHAGQVVGNPGLCWM